MRRLKDIYPSPWNILVFVSAISALFQCVHTGKLPDNATLDPLQNGRHYVEHDNSSNIIGNSSVQAKVFSRMDLKALYTILKSKIHGTSTKSSCKIHPADKDMHAHIKLLLNRGTKLIKFLLNFDEYEEDPLQSDNYFSWNYQPYLWYRAYNNHGRTLLTLAFNYDVLSIQLLAFGVETVNVSLIDSPKGCFGKLSEIDKISKLLFAVVVDFAEGDITGPNMVIGGEGQSCRQFIQKIGDYGKYKFMCCGWHPDKKGDNSEGINDCSDNERGVWLTILFGMFGVLNILSYLFGPLFLEWLIKGTSIHRMAYQLYLRADETVKVDTADLPNVGNVDKYTVLYKDRNKLPLLKRISKLRNDPAHDETQAELKKLLLFVNQQELMHVNEAPVGLIHFLLNNFLLCKIRYWDTFQACCKASIFGNWSYRFLCFTLGGAKHNRSKPCLSWGTLMRVVGGLLIIVLIPIPYYIRLAVYYLYENEEVQNQLAALNNVGLKPLYQHNMLHYLTPTHVGFVCVYIIYVFSLVSLSICRVKDPSQFNEIIVDAIQDMRSVNKSKCLKLIVLHLILPLEKFGIWGVFVGLLYWPIVIPICGLVSACYCIPTIYLLGRFIVDKRPTFLRKWKFYLEQKNKPGHRKIKEKYGMSKGFYTIEECLLLNRISPENEEIITHRTLHLSKKGDGKTLKDEHTEENTAQLCCFGWVTGVLAICFMVSSLILFGEVFIFLFEVFVFTLMGVIVNASHAYQYVTLVFYMIMYASNCFNYHYETYLKLNKEVFSFIKGKLELASGNELSPIESVVSLGKHVQMNTAFKYFSNKEIEDHRLLEEDAARSDSGEDPSDNDSSDEEQTKERKEENRVSDKIENKDGELVLKVHSLVLFIDYKDSCRIPKELFRQITNIEAPGCPGPIGLGLIQALKQLVYMVTFLFCVVIVVMTFGDTYEVSTTNQFLMTMAGGFVPFFIRNIIKPKKNEIFLNNYSFKGKIQQIIRSYHQSWPVYDMSFNKNTVKHEQTIPRNGVKQSSHSAENPSYYTDNTKNDFSYYGAPYPFLPIIPLNNNRVGINDTHFASEEDLDYMDVDV